MALVLFILILFLSGCDSDSDKSVTGDFVDTEPRGLERTVVAPESLHVTGHFKKSIGTTSYTLAGRHETIEAFSVFKFPVYKVRRDNAIGAYVTFDIEDTWKGSLSEFALYETHIDWSDTTALDPDIFLSQSGTPLATVSDTASVITGLSFTIDHEVVQLWGDDGALLLKSSDAGTSMVSVLSDNTTYPPVLHLIKQMEAGYIDTSEVNCTEATYFLRTTAGEDSPFVSEGDGSGYVLSFTIPKEIPAFATINKCILKLSFLDRILPEDPFYVGFYRLTEPLVNADEAETDTDTGVRLTIYSDTETEEIDITRIVNAWHIGGETNYGIIVEPINPGASPNQCIIATLDSLEFTYTPFPPVK